MTAAAACERILRTLQSWFDIEASLLGNVRQSMRLPTFPTHQAGSLVALFVKHGPAGSVHGGFAAQLEQLLVQRRQVHLVGTVANAH